MGKQRIVKFGTDIHNTEGILDYVHSDVWGPTKSISMGGSTTLLLLLMTFQEELECML